jgi:hypothetical protein
MESGSDRASAVTAAGVSVVAGSIGFGALLSLHEAADKTLSTSHFALDDVACGCVLFMESSFRVSMSFSSR